jgi:CRP-like cAMP-binding protein
MLESSRRSLLADVFPGIAEPTLAEVMRRAEYLEATEGEIIVRQGDPADAMYVIENGTVDIRELPAGSGREQLVATLHQRQFFGEVGALTGGQRNASAYARTPTRLIRLDRDLLNLIAGYREPFGDIAAGEKSYVVTQSDAAWTKVIRSACHALAVTHGAIRTIDLALQPIGDGGPMQLVALIGRARELAWEYGVQVHGSVSGGRPIIHLSESPGT